MPKIKVYLDTSVVSAYFDNREPFRKDLTIKWWKNKIKGFDKCISNVTLNELKQDREPKRSLYLKLVKGFTNLKITSSVEKLAEAYMNEKIIPRKYIADAFHIAIASIHKIDYLVTWNINHMAAVSKREEIKKVTFSKKIFVPDIVTPELF